MAVVDYPPTHVLMRSPSVRIRLVLLLCSLVLTTQSACSQDTTHGRLDPSDPTLENGEHYDTYTLEVEAGQWIEVDLRTSNFDPYLVVMAPSGEAQQNDDFEESRERSYLRFQASESGTWRVFATSYAADETGRYELVMDVHDREPPCSNCGIAQVVSQDGGVRYERGELAPGDDELETGEYYDTYTIQGRAGETLVLDLNADGFDPYLILVYPDEEQVENDDHEGDRTRSMITAELDQTGSYRVLVTSYQKGERGRYDLTVRGGEGESSVQFAAATGVRNETGRLDASDTTLRQGEFYDTYTFEGVPGQRVMLDLRSSEFDTYLVLQPPRGEALQNDDYEDDLSRSVIEADLTEPGTYRVYVTSYAAEETGAYTLAMDFSGGFGREPAPDAPSAQPVTRTVSTLSASELTINETLRGALTQNDRRLETGEFVDLHVFDGEAGEPIRIEMTSTEFDTYLFVTTPTGQLVDNDDFDGSTNVSRIDMVMPVDGRYRIEAASFRPGETGSYTIRISQLDAMEADPPAYDRIAGLFVGISDYGGRQSNLAYTAQDAHSIRDALIEGGGMRPEDGIVLTDAQATTTNVRNAIRDLAARTDERTLFVFFYSGHGGQYRRSAPQASDPDGLDESIELYDAEILDDDFNRLLGQLPAAQQLIVLDACFSGGFSKDVISQPGRMGLFSSEEDVISSVASKFEAGGYLSRFFSDALLDRAADEDGNGALTPLELSEYLRGRYRGDVRNSGLEAIVARETRLGNQHLVVDRGSFYAFSTLFVLR